MHGIELQLLVTGRQHSPVVYFARIRDDAVKIGTTTCLRQRMTSMYLRLEDVLLVVPGGPESERAYHRLFRDQRVLGGALRELFRIDGALAAFLEPVLTWSTRTEPVTASVPQSHIAVPTAGRERARQLIQASGPVGTDVAAIVRRLAAEGLGVDERTVRRWLADDIKHGFTVRTRRGLYRAVAA